MAATNPLPRSFLGCGTTTIPGRSGCLKTWCEPRVRSRTHPFASSARISSELLMGGFYTHRVYEASPRGLPRGSVALPLSFERPPANPPGPRAVTPDPKALSHLDRLEAESIHILREVAAEFRNP